MKTFRRLYRPTATALLCTMLATSLSGCAELLIGSAVVSAVSAADRRTLGSQTEDKAIVLKANHMVDKLVGSGGQIEVTSYNRKVLLTGAIVNDALKQELERNVAAIPNVEGVTSDIVVADYAQSLGSRTQDALVTTKVKAILTQKTGLQASLFKVVTVRGQVYLLGLVTQHEGHTAAEAVRQVGGVEKVHKMFEYITEDQVPKSSVAQQ